MRGGEEGMIGSVGADAEEVRLSGTSWSSSSETLGVLRIVEDSDSNEFWRCRPPTGCVRPRYAVGEDSGSWNEVFQVAFGLAARVLLRDCVRETGRLGFMSLRKRLDESVLLPERSISSEKMGAVRGEDIGALDEEKHCPEALDEVSDRASTLEIVRLRLSSRSISGSMESMLRFCQPCLILTLASARRSCSARVICSLA